MVSTQICLHPTVRRQVSGSPLRVPPFMLRHGLIDIRQDGLFASREVADAAVHDRTGARLDGTTILLVEDEAIVAMDIRFALTDVGATVLGPAATLSDGFGLAQDAVRIDGAILDIDLAGETVFQLADLLVSRSVPFVFHSGAPPVADIEMRYPEAPLLRKPVAIEELLIRLVDRMG